MLGNDDYRAAFYLCISIYTKPALSDLPGLCFSSLAAAQKQGNVQDRNAVWLWDRWLQYFMQSRCKEVTFEGNMEERKVRGTAQSGQVRSVLTPLS